MTRYTSPTSSPTGQPSEPPNEAALLAMLEATADAVRFRLEGVENDLAQQRPSTAARSMAEVLGQMREREITFVQQLSHMQNPQQPRQDWSTRPSPFLHDTNHLNDLGQFLQRRQESLALLRKLSRKQWYQTVEHPQLGSLTILRLCRHVVEQDARDLNDLADLRRALQGGDTPGTAGIMPGY